LPLFGFPTNAICIVFAITKMPFCIKQKGAKKRPQNYQFKTGRDLRYK
jgi:hypothetical protein